MPIRACPNPVSTTESRSIGGNTATGKQIRAGRRRRRTVSDDLPTFSTPFDPESTPAIARIRALSDGNSSNGVD
jgi:hypothetical protein